MMLDVPFLRRDIVCPNCGDRFVATIADEQPMAALLERAEAEILEGLAQHFVTDHPGEAIKA